MPFIGNFFLAIAIPLCVAMFFIKGKSRLFCVFMTIGMMTCLLSAYLNSFFQLVFHMSTQETAIFITPLCEEIMKLLPVLFFVIIFEPRNDEILTTALTVGVGFTTLENCCYLLELVEEDIQYTLIRGFAAGLMHTVCALTVGIGLTVFKRYGKIGIVGAIGIFVTAYSYHAIYNLLVSGEGYWRMAAYGMPFLTILVVFIFYRNGMFHLSHKEEIENEYK